MTDRARQVYALLRTMLAWCPGPRSTSDLARVARGFVAGTDHLGRPLRYRSCEDCLANGKPDGMRGCETCGGRGEIPDPGPDPYQRPGKVLFTSSVDRRDREQARDREIDRLDQMIRQHSDEEAAPDPLTSAVEMRDRMYRQGSYLELERELQRLRFEQPAAYEIATGVAYQPFGEVPTDAVRPVVVAICELLATRMPDPIRVPGFVAISSDAELEQRVRLGKDALWRGHSAWAEARRSERRALARAMAAEGLPAGTIGKRLNVHKRTVERWLCEDAERQVATGPAA